MESGKDDLHSKLFEVRAQMCDISRQISANETSYHKQICDGQIEARKKLIDMEKKKMTKAEAFEYLKGKRVACDCLNDEDVQRKLFEVGIRWRGGKADVTAAAPFLYINPDGLTHGGSFEWFNLHEYEEISADDILSIEIVDEDNKDKPKRFSDYVAIIQSQLVDDEVIVITKKNCMTMVK